MYLVGLEVTISSFIRIMGGSNINYDFFLVKLFVML